MSFIKGMLVGSPIVLVGNDIVELVEGGSAVKDYSSSSKFIGSAEISENPEKMSEFSVDTKKIPSTSNEGSLSAFKQREVKVIGMCEDPLQDITTAGLPDEFVLKTSNTVNNINDVNLFFTQSSSAQGSYIHSYDQPNSFFTANDMNTRLYKKSK